MTPDQQIIGTAIKFLLDIVKQHVTKTLSETHAKAEVLVPQFIQTALLDVEQWSSRIQFYGMSRAKTTDDSTIALNLSTELRRFKTAGDTSTFSSELDLLNDSQHYVLLGDPGAGKTTTLKRLARRLLLYPPTSPDDIYQYPLVIRLRELDHTSSLLEQLASYLGLGLKRDDDHTQGKAPDEIPRPYKGTKVGQLELWQALGIVLNATRAVVFVDGLDEVPGTLRNRVISQIEELARIMNRSKLIVTCRSGEFMTHIDGLDVMEICPLNAAQVVDVAERWLGGNAPKFLTSVRTLPYYDVTNRPLLLAQLALLYEHYGYLPEQPASVYRKVVRLLLEDWDSERRIVRPSKYAGFMPDRKADFLAALSYHLTYRVKQTVFTESALVEAYRQVYQNFNLPASEAVQVAQEIETHSGIIVETGNDQYEFSHLSLQEYLCAEYLVKDPFPETIAVYISNYSAPVAVAVGLSSNPTNWFCALFLTHRLSARFKIASLSAFLHRILIERPSFEISPFLGFAVLHIYGEFRRHPEFSIVRNDFYLLIKWESVKLSIARALALCSLGRRDGDDVVFQRKYIPETDHSFTLPEHLYVPMDVYLEWKSLNEARY